MHTVIERGGTMTNNVIHHLHDYIEERCRSFVTGHELREKQIDRAIQMHLQRGATIVRSFVEGDVIRSTTFDQQVVVDYVQHEEYLIKVKDGCYLEEKESERRAKFQHERLLSDQEISMEGRIEEFIEFKGEELSDEKEQAAPYRATYDRRKAVQYAERWWNDYNPQYQKFENNCTNFISQCLRAGGAEMHGFSNRSKGWWYSGNNWSYSWSVANALRWYLSGAKQV